MFRALALVAVVGGSAAGDPLPALPVLPAQRPAPDRPLIVELFGGLAASLEGTDAGSVGVRVTRDAWSAELALDLAIPETRDMTDVWRGGGTLAGCRHVALLGLCPIAHAGWVHASGGALTMAETAPVVAVGGRLELELQVSHRIAVRSGFDGRIFLTSSAFTPRAEGWLGVDLIVRISR